jgi:two-component system sensor histidine kinase KdpD
MANELGAPTDADAGTAARGRHKIFLGMAAGVGKTYRMLQEGHAEAELGRDVVIGYLEPHDRPDTAAQATGLETLPRRGLSYRGNRIEEMDLVGILDRDPELCLIDELAHSNAPGVEHAKRYEDVLEVLGAGIDVYSTVNIQHLESLNDRVTELTGVKVRETIPDSLLSDRAGAARAPAGGQDLQARRHRRGARWLLPGGEPRRPA